MGHSEQTWVGDKLFGSTELHEIFEKEVKNDKIAWYVDYFTENAPQYNVRYLAEEGEVQVMMTNEDKEQRDANDPEGSQWKDVDVAEWFGRTKPQHTFVFVFAHDSGEIFGIHCEAWRVFPFGPRALSLPATNLWEAYIQDGILGPLKACLGTDTVKLVAIVADSRFATLEKYGLTQEYMLTLAAVLDK